MGLNFEDVGSHLCFIDAIVLCARGKKYPRKNNSFTRNSCFVGLLFACMCASNRRTFWLIGIWSSVNLIFPIPRSKATHSRNKTIATPTEVPCPRPRVRVPGGGAVRTGAQGHQARHRPPLAGQPRAAGTWNPWTRDMIHSPCPSETLQKSSCFFSA